MLSFGGSDEHTMLGESLGRMLGVRNEFEDRARRLSASPPDRLALWSNLCELGAISAILPKALGGFGDRAVDVAAVFASIVVSLPVEPVLSTLTVGRLLRHVEGQDEIKALIAEGGVIAIGALAEGFDPFAEPLTRLEPAPGGVLIRGFKPAVRNADVTDYLVVSGRGDDGRLLLAWVPIFSACIDIAPMRLIDGAGAADLRFDGLCEGAVILSISDVGLALRDAWAWTLAMLAVESASIAAAARTLTFDYMKTREQFGEKLAGFQALQHRAADMAIAVEEAAAMASAAIRALDESDLYTAMKVALRASLAGDKAGRLVAHAAMQMFGGMGVSEESIVSHHARRLAAIRNQMGSMDARYDHLARIEGFQ